MLTKTRRPLALALLAALSVSLPSVATTVWAAQGQAGDGGTRPARRSLEDLLKEVEIERARASAALQPEIDRIAKEIAKLRTKVAGPTTRAKQRELVNLGPAALPLLIPYMDPGKEATRSEVFRSEIITDVVRSNPSPTVTDAVILVAERGTLVGRVNALHALETTPEPKRAVQTIIAIADGKAITGMAPEDVETLRDAGFRAIASMGTPTAAAFLTASIKSSDAGRAAAALRALQRAPAERSALQVLGLLASDNAPELAGAIGTYYGAHEPLLEDDDHAQALGKVALADGTSNTDRVALFDLLRLTDAKLSVQVKRGLGDYSEAARQDVRRAALLLLARNKDRGARRELLAEHDDRVRDGRNEVEAYSARARVYYEIGDWNASVKDWRAVMKAMAADRVNRRRKEPYIGIARSLARLKKYRDAADYLTDAPVSLDELRSLAKERDFRDMLDSRYREAFRLIE